MTIQIKATEQYSLLVYCAVLPSFVCKPQYVTIQLFFFSYLQLCDFLEAGNRLACPEECPEEVYDVMYSCWLEDASKRPTFYLLETNYLAALLEKYPVSGL